MVCDLDNIDAATNTCTTVQYVQAPMLVPPLSSSDGALLGSAIWGLWYLAAVWRAL